MSGRFVRQRATASMPSAHSFVLDMDLPLVNRKILLDIQRIILYKYKKSTIPIIKFHFSKIFGAPNQRCAL